MVANQPPDEPEELNPDKPDANLNPNGTEGFRDKLLRGLGPDKEKTQKPASPPNSEEEMLNDRLSIFMDTPESAAGENENWLDNFWNNEIPDQEKLTEEESAQDGVEFNSSDDGPSSRMLDDYLYEEWGRSGEKNSEQTPESSAKNSDFINLPSPDGQDGQPISLPEPHPFSYLEGLEDSLPLKEEENSIFSKPENRSSDTLVEMRSWIQEDQAEKSDPFLGAYKQVEEKKWALQKLTRLEIFLVAFIILLALITGLILLRSIFFLPAVKDQNPIVAPPAANVTADILPNPTELEMTGGWRFTLNKSTIVNNQWKPTGPEWLNGADVSRIIALPWNTQLEAIFHSLNIGDIILLSFSNQTQIKYKVQKSEQVAVTDAELMNSTTPSLVVFLYGQDSPMRWVITCLP